MKKILIGIVVALAVIAVVAVVAVVLFLDKGVKKGIETVGPMLTKTTMTVESVSLSPFSGAGSIKGMVIGNPEGYKASEAIKVGKASLAVSISSLLSDKVVIKSIRVEGPEITYETNLKTSNLGTILDNLQKLSSPEAQPAKEEKASTKKLQVDDFLISGGKIHVTVTSLGSQSVTVPLPDVHLTDLGKGPEGITAAEVTKLALDRVVKEAMKSAGPAMNDLSKQANDLISKEAGKAATNAVDKATKSIGNMLKKK
jgi:uncharacterized protein involved in outer membrane biogenesis